MGTAPTTSPAPCPICGKPRADKYRPFCSRRCADVDLHRWFSGAYAVPAVEDDEASDDEVGDSPPTVPKR